MHPLFYVANYLANKRISVFRNNKHLNYNNYWLRTSLKNLEQPENSNILKNVSKNLQNLINYTKAAQ